MSTQAKKEIAEREIAASFEADPALLPHLPFLLQDLDELGWQSGNVIELLRARRLPEGAHALDLGCGKGALALKLAEEFGWHVAGVDLFAPFIEQAQREALQRGVSERCRFVEGDARQLLERSEEVDVALLVSVGPLFGTLRETVKAMRRAVRSGGILVIEEMYLKPGADGETGGYEVFEDRAALITELTAHGDRIVGALEHTSEEFASWNADTLEKIERRASELIAARKELRPLVEVYVETQRAACRALETAIVCGVWLLQRS